MNECVENKSRGVLIAFESQLPVGGIRLVRDSLASTVSPWLVANRDSGSSSSHAMHQQRGSDHQVAVIGALRRRANCVELVAGRLSHSAMRGERMRTKVASAAQKHVFCGLNVFAVCDRVNETAGDNCRPRLEEVRSIE